MSYPRRLHSRAGYFPHVILPIGKERGNSTVKIGPKAEVDITHDQNIAE